MQIPRMSSRAGLLKPSPTLGITAKAQLMKAEGREIISLAAGEPDFPTPDPICQAAIAAIQEGYTKYTATPGIKELREAIVRKLKRENGVEASPDEIVVSCGAKHSLFNAMMVLLEAGDEAIVFAPYWMTYVDQIDLAGAKAVVIETSVQNDFIPSLQDIKAAITPRTRAIIINSPSNPTGATYSGELLAEMANLATEHDLWLISDEIYEHLVYDHPHASVLSAGDSASKRTVFVSGCSKTYAMTGWRIGFAYAPQPVATAMSSLQDQVTSNANSIAQRAAIVAFDLPAEQVTQMRNEFKKRRELTVELLCQIPGVRANKPDGAFYVFADVSALLNGETDAELAERILECEGVATIPGSVFGGPGHLRLSYAASEADIRKGVERIAEVLQRRR